MSDEVRSPRFRMTWWQKTIAVSVVLFLSLFALVLALRVRWAPDIDLSTIKLEPQPAAYSAVAELDEPAQRVFESSWSLICSHLGSYTEELPFDIYDQYSSGMEKSDEYKQLYSDIQPHIKHLLQLPSFKIFRVAPVHDDFWEGYERVIILNVAISSARAGDWDLTYAALDLYVTLAVNLNVNGDSWSCQAAITDMQHYIYACRILASLQNVDQRLLKHMQRSLRFYEDEKRDVPDIMRNDCQVVIESCKRFYESKSGFEAEIIKENFPYIMYISDRDDSITNIKSMFAFKLKLYNEGKEVDDFMERKFEDHWLQHLPPSVAMMMVEDPVGAFCLALSEVSYDSFDADYVELTRSMAMTMALVQVSVQAQAGEDLTINTITNFYGMHNVWLIKDDTKWMIYGGPLPDEAEPDEEQLMKMLHLDSDDEELSGVIILRPYVESTKAD